MTYSTIPGNETRKDVFSSYEHIGSILKTRSRINSGLYLCVVKPTNDGSIIRLDLPGLVEMINVGTNVDFIIESSPDDIGDIARKIYEQTGNPVGVAKYQESQSPGLLQSNAILAARRAEKNGNGFYVFDDYKDSAKYKLSHLIH